MTVVKAVPRDARVEREAKALSEHGYQVTVVCLHNDSVAEREVIDGFEINRVRLRTRGLPQRMGWQIIKYLEFLLKAAKAIASERPAVVHTHDLSALPIGYLASRRCGARLVHDAHELESDVGPFAKAPRWYSLASRMAEHVLLRRTDAVITVSDGIAAELVSQDGIEHPVVLRNVPETVDQDAPTVDLKRLLGLSTEHRIVLYQGHVSLPRGVGAVVEALPHLDERIVFVMLGRCSPEVKQQITQQAEALSVDGRVMFMDAVPFSRLLSHSRSADVGVVPTISTGKSRLYALPNKLFEYTMAGIPVAVSDFPERRKIVEEYGIGTWFDPNDPEDIARAIRAVLEPPERYAELRRNSTEAAKELNWDREQSVLLDLYDRLMLRT